MTASYISDGYTEEVYFAEFPKVHGEFRCTLRPLSINQHSAVNKDLEEAGNDWERRNWVAAKWISKQVISWNITKKGGEPVDHTIVDEVMRLRPALFTRLWNVLNNTEGGDVDPKASAFEMQKRAETERLVATSSGTKQEVLEKNS